MLLWFVLIFISPSNRLAFCVNRVMLAYEKCVSWTLWRTGKCKYRKKSDIEHYLVLDRNLLGSSRFPYTHLKMFGLHAEVTFLFISYKKRSTSCKQQATCWISEERTIQLGSIVLEYITGSAEVRGKWGSWGRLGRVWFIFL